MRQEEKEVEGEIWKRTVLLCALLAAHLALDTGVSGTWTLVTRTYCYLLSNSLNSALTI